MLACTVPGTRYAAPGTRGSRLEYVQRVLIDWSLKVYTQLAREGVVLTQDGDTELPLVLSSRRVAARGDSCKEAIGEINLPFLPLSVPLYLIYKSLVDMWNSLI